MRYILIFLTVFTALSSCSLKVSESDHEVLKVNHQIVQKGEANFIEFKLMNPSDSSLRLVDPYGLHIEFKNGENWELLRTLDCPCGASCPPPPTEFYLKKGEEHIVNWNMKEEWCGEKQLGGRPPQSFSEDVEKGIYRLRIPISDPQGKSQFVYYQFEIR